MRPQIQVPQSPTFHFQSARFQRSTFESAGAFKNIIQILVFILPVVAKLVYYIHHLIDNLILNFWPFSAHVIFPFKKKKTENPSNNTKLLLGDSVAGPELVTVLKESRIPNHLGCSSFPNAFILCSHHFHMFSHIFSTQVRFLSPAT